MTTSTKFWDKIADKYSKQPIADEASYQSKLTVTQEYFNPDMEVLEFACGTGGTALIHAPFVKHIRAIDISEKMIAIAQSQAETNKINNITFEQLTIEELKPENNNYDAVLGLSILHLLEDKERAIAQVYSLLKPGGIFVTNLSSI